MIGYVVRQLDKNKKIKFFGFYLAQDATELYYLVDREIDVENMQYTSSVYSGTEKGCGILLQANYDDDNNADIEVAMEDCSPDELLSDIKKARVWLSLDKKRV